MEITRLQLYTPAIMEQYHFYRDTLGLEVARYSENSFELKLGYSLLEFRYKRSATPYHLAFHIPAHQEKAALEWVGQRQPVLKAEGEEIVDFKAWNARSIYFYDRDHNILELISRKNFFKEGPEDFSAESLLGISEVGLATVDVREKFDFLHRQCGLEQYDGDLEKFCAIGDDRGLLITINRKKKDWFPVDDKAYASPFYLEFRHHRKKYQLIFEKDLLRLVP